MAKVGIFFGTDTGSTRRIAKTIVKIIGSDADKPVNIRKATVEDLMAYEMLILGTPTYGEGKLPGKSTGNATESWEEFLPQMKGSVFDGKKVALFGLGNQKAYGNNFVSALRDLYDAFSACGAQIIGDGWDSTEYRFKFSRAIIDGHFVGLVLDEENQKDLTEERLEAWLAEIAPAWI